MISLEYCSKPVLAAELPSPILPSSMRTTDMPAAVKTSHASVPVKPPADDQNVAPSGFAGEGRVPGRLAAGGRPEQGTEV
ncbi:hypothetical protein OMP38_14880 [Cohnella ginsengisoli]|uniref:Uncharacterized protein n=1 Tax=Cohnella ginsengisoli TaxID=425004 RepID=A0A9X4KM19_9BACL|nr:hypothetical protein [Cohnella ginsengisoli]MDG0792000.1 hypothetical protein [Cohnella ginsengisoli]